ncbi:MAG: Smr/MutS family protein [Rickettsiales bacterium]|nr:Smr/MutS family protein [Rickettsiales bacterium]
MSIFRPALPTDLQPDDMAGIHKRMAQRLRRGQEIPEGTLDLHGDTQMQASHHFQQFIHESSHAGLRVVRVITGYGKMTGKGVLKAALPRWVNFPENRRLILSYHQARPEEGGSGAWVILLKRKERL